MPRLIGPDFTNGLKSEHESTGYPSNWTQISAAFRKARNHTCTICKVCCETHPHLVDANHINGVKSDCDYSNLQCLCKYCHSEQDYHSHYKPKPEELKILSSLWRDQKISPPEHN